MYSMSSFPRSVFKECPGLKHLNIGQVPKVNTHSLMVMASQLKCLLSLNLTALQAVSLRLTVFQKPFIWMQYFMCNYTRTILLQVTDATVDMLLQNCYALQSLILSSCPGVTDLTLYSISKYTPCIRYKYMHTQTQRLRDCNVKRQ